MEERYNREDELMRRLLNEAGTEKPSRDFKSQLMMRIESRNAEIKPYKPLISGTVWVVLGGVFLLSMLGLYFINSGISLPFEFTYKIPDLFEIPKLELSKNMQYAVAFIALFFLQIPILKRLMERNYQL